MTRTTTCLRVFAVFAATALLLAACGDEDGPSDEADRGSLVVGSVDFDENVIVASMYAEVLADAGYDVSRRFGLGTRELVLPAVENGEIDVFPEYVGSSVEFLEGGATGDTQETTELLRGLLEERGLTVLEPAGAQNTNALVVTAETAEEYDLSATSDLADVAGELVLGGPPECPERPLCLIGFRDVYGIEFSDFQPLDAGGPVTVQALRDGNVDVALLFSTDESIAEYGWVLLDDDEELQPAENIAPVVRDEVLNDEITDLLDSVSAELTTDEITALNRRVRLEGQDPEDVAEEWLRDRGLIG
jgi:osmoprotectant transport system substrate-binding protein